MAGNNKKQKQNTKTQDVFCTDMNCVIRRGVHRTLCPEEHGCQQKHYGPRPGDPLTAVDPNRFEEKALQ